MKEYNDNELLYLLSENNDFAFEMLLEKYRPMIVSRLHRYHVKKDYWDDYFQECVILLYKCATSYRDDITKTFNRYYDRLLQYQIQNLLRKDRQNFYHVMLMTTDEIDNMTFYRMEEKSSFQPLDKSKQDIREEVWQMACDGATIKEIADSNHLNYYQAYHMVRKVRTKREDYNKNKSIYSNLEKNILELSNSGYRPREISSLLSISTNRVYNALKRLRNKQKNLDGKNEK